MNTNGNAAVITDPSDGKKYTVGILEITPEDAKERIKRMIHNRPVKEKKVVRIAEAIIEDNYKLNGQPLILSSSGCGLDGNHRLHSCVRANKSIKTFVIEGVSEEVFPTLDLFERKLSETLVAEHGLDMHRASITASVINLSWALRNTHNIQAKNFPPTWKALAFYMQEKAEIDRRIVEAEEKFTTKILPTAKLVCLWHEFANVDSDKAKIFFMAMCGLNHSYEPFDRLREMFVADLPKLAKRRIEPRLKLAYCIKAFNSLLSGASVQFTMKSREGFPIITGTEKEQAVAV